MQKFLALILIPPLVGCFTSRVQPVSYWPVEYKGSAATAPSPKFGVTRVLPIAVRAPYGTRSMTVLRADGTVAFDPLNEFAALPSQLAKGVLVDALAASGLCRDIVDTGSIATSDISVEVLVERLALDCRQEGRRTAVAEVVVKVLTGHSIVSSVKGSGTSDAADGNYGEAFSGALSSAFAVAFGQLR